MAVIIRVSISLEIVNNYWPLSNDRFADACNWMATSGTDRQTDKQTQTTDRCFTLTAMVTASQSRAVQLNIHVLGYLIADG